MTNTLLLVCGCCVVACSAYDPSLLDPARSSAEGILGALAGGSARTGLASLEAGRADGVASAVAGRRDLDNGRACIDDGDCKSAHCRNDRCCTEGDCCFSSPDCGDGGMGSACTNQSKCQGVVRSWTCRDFQCLSIDGGDDDTACDESVEASDCGPYLSVHCSGEQQQIVAGCETSCRDDEQCDAQAHCDEGACVSDEANGGACERDEQCSSAHCDESLCCANADCCMQASDCAAEYASAAECVDAGQCQGARGGLGCVDFECRTEMIDDDSACESDTRALTCDGYADVFCDGGQEQNPPTCPLGCSLDSDCDADHHCVDAVCEPDRSDGQACTAASQCESGHCDAGVCCESGECCATDQDCAQVPVCSDPTQCLGYVQGRRCNDASQCEDGTRRLDSIGCTGQLARYCGAYRDVRCLRLSAPVVWECASSCAVPAECNWGYTCNGSECVPFFQ